jgi:hypothetical protein
MSHGHQLASHKRLADNLIFRQLFASDEAIIHGLFTSALAKGLERLPRYKPPSPVHMSSRMMQQCLEQIANRDRLSWITGNLPVARVVLNGNMFL